MIYYYLFDILKFLRNQTGGHSIAQAGDTAVRIRHDGTQGANRVSYNPP